MFLSTGVDKNVYAFAMYPITGLSTGVIRQLFSVLYRISYTLNQLHVQVDSHISPHPQSVDPFENL